jgi:hypothetical protein
VAEVEVFTPAGVFAGTTSRIPLINDGPDLGSALAIQDARWYPLDGSRAAHRGSVTVQLDDILVIVTAEPELKVHVAWYSVALEVGPYRVSGRLATHPGFDPARAIARPSGSFVPLSDVTIEIARHDQAASASRPYVHVNRYAVERVTSTLMLGHFFPGARLIAEEAPEPVA